MYKTSRELKAKALQSLSGKWGTAVLINLAMGLIVMPLTRLSSTSGISGLISILSNCLTIIFSVGYTSFLLKLCCGQKDQAGFADLFYGFKCHPGKAILLYLLTILYLLPGALIFGIFVGVIIVIGISSVNDPSLLMMINYGDFSSISDWDLSFFSGLIAVLVVCLILYMIYAVYISAKYGLVYLLLLDYPELPTMQIWKRSAQLMKGHKWRSVKLSLSFLPAIFIPSIAVIFLAAIPVVNVLAFIIYCIIIFVVTIHMSAASVEFYLDLVQTKPNVSASKPRQTGMADYTEVMSDSNLTHDCEDAHGNTFEQTENNYSGIDKDTFK